MMTETNETEQIWEAHKRPLTESEREEWDEHFRAVVGQNRLAMALIEACSGRCDGMVMVHGASQQVPGVYLAVVVGGMSFVNREQLKFLFRELLDDALPQHTKRNRRAR